MSQEPVIQIDHLSYAYPDGTKALQNITLRIMEKERVGILGANGAGKSTLLLHLNGILQGTGEVRILGLPVTRKNLEAIRRAVGVVFQNPDDQLFCPTVFEDVAFGPRNMDLPEDEVEKRVRESLDAVGMAGRQTSNAHHLSLGEKKRVSLATVLSMKPEILAFDEPTANLDPKGRKEIEELLMKMDKTLIVVSHDVERAKKLCGRILLLCKGKIAVDGPPSLLDDPDLLRRTDLA
jgi:cobalt/nickel transport system ATP-binding protein